MFVYIIKDNKLPEKIRKIKNNLQEFLLAKSFVYCCSSAFEQKKIYLICLQKTLELGHLLNSLIKHLYVIMNLVCITVNQSSSEHFMLIENRDCLSE